MAHQKTLALMVACGATQSISLSVLKLLAAPPSPECSGEKVANLYVYLHSDLAGSTRGDAIEISPIVRGKQPSASSDETRSQLVDPPNLECLPSVESVNYLPAALPRVPQNRTCNLQMPQI
jgi:hypothetical protein